MKISALIDLDTEKEVIGCLLNDNESFLSVYGDLRPEDFGSTELNYAYAAFSEIYQQKGIVDLHSLLQKTNLNPVLLGECLEKGWFSADLKHKAAKIIELGHKRRTFIACNNLIPQLPFLEPEEISAQLSEMAVSISLRNEKKRIYGTEELAERVELLQTERSLEPGYVRGIKLGYPYLDSLIRGLRPKRMTVIAAATGFGKTSLALNLLHNTTVGGHSGLYISNENDVDDNLDRLCGMVADLEVKDVERGTCGDQVIDAFRMTYCGKTLFLSDNSPRTIDEIIATINRYVIQHQIEIVYLDYIGEIAGHAQAKESDEAMLARYTQSLLNCIKSLGIHLILLAQMNREGNRLKRPTKAELGQCFRIAQKAHTMLVFWNDGGNQDVITLEKNRQGPPGTDVAVLFNRNKQIITEQGIWLPKQKAIYHPIIK